MANYEYIARNASGEEVAGVMQAESETAVIRTLDERQLYPVRVAEQSPVARGGGSRRIKPQEVGVLYGQLADLLRSGVPMLRSLDILIRAGTRPALAAVVRVVRDDVSGGKTLAEAMGVHGAVFAPLHCAMVRAGEQAGFLEDVLSNLANYVERQDELRAKVRGAMIYPLMLVGLGTLVMVGVLVLFVPKFKPLLSRIELPLPTKVMFAASDLLVEHLGLLVVALVLCVVAVRGLVRSPGGKIAWERWRLRLPAIGAAMRMVSLTRFCRILGTLLHNGVPIIASLDIAKDATGSPLLAGAIERAAQNVRAGETLAAPLRESRLFPPQIVEMIAVAEESNQMDKVLLQIADTVERRSNRQIDQAVRLMEPALLVLLAIGIGFMVLGILYPIFQLSNSFAR
jgi:general secretion pathway protein F/type IV pilus assembly protein PilC